MPKRAPKQKLKRTIAITINTEFTGNGTGALGESTAFFWTKLKRALNDGGLNRLNKQWLSEVDEDLKSELEDTLTTWVEIEAEKHDGGIITYIDNPREVIDALLDKLKEEGVIKT